MNYEVIVLVISCVLSAYTIWRNIAYMIRLYVEMNEWKFISLEKLHSQQHFAIAWVMVIVSLLLFLETVFYENCSMQFLIIILYNFVVSLIILPHLISEK